VRSTLEDELSELPEGVPPPQIRMLGGIVVKARAT
jgi:hypothetical protein